MSRACTFEADLIEIVADVTGLRGSRIRPEARLIEDLGLDSFSAMELLVLIEKKYRINISEAELMTHKTLRDWARLIAERSPRVKTTQGFST